MLESSSKQGYISKAYMALYLLPIMLVANPVIPPPPPPIGLLNTLQGSKQWIRSDGVALSLRLVLAVLSTITVLI